MKVAIFFSNGVSLDTWRITGLLAREVKLYNELAEKYGIEFTFITYGDESDCNILKGDSRIKVVPVYKYMPRYKNKVIRILQTTIIPIILRNKLKKMDLYKTNQLWGGWVAVISKWLFRKPLLVRSGFEFNIFAKKEKRSLLFLYFSKFISRILYRSADHIHVATECDRDYVIQNFSVAENKIEVRPNWIDTKVYKNYNLPRVMDKILFVGRFSEQKNIPLLIKALEGTGLILSLYGQGQLESKIMNLAKEKNVSVEMCGVYSNNDMPDIYNKYQIYVLCSKFEGNPKSLLEAMSCGCSVVGTNVFGINNIIRNLENGLLSEENSSDLRRVILSLKNSSDLQISCGKEARNSILRNNSLKSACALEIQAYRSLVNR
jgi:glycosyltransferase involved in cell wall biosynthesis